MNTLQKCDNRDNNDNNGNDNDDDDDDNNNNNINNNNNFFLLAVQHPLGVVFYSPLVGFSLLAYEVS